MYEGLRQGLQSITVLKLSDLKLSEPKKGKYTDQLDTAASLTTGKLS